MDDSVGKGFRNAKGPKGEKLCQRKTDWWRMLNRSSRRLRESCQELVGDIKLFDFHRQQSTRLISWLGPSDVDAIVGFLPGWVYGIPIPRPTRPSRGAPKWKG